MTSATASSPAFLLFSPRRRPNPNPNPSPFSLPFALPRRPRPLLPPLRPGLVVAAARRRARARPAEDAFGVGGGSADLEAEIYEFMRRSPKPDDFPSRAELVDAGRADLADAVAAQGGWLALGWDVDEQAKDGNGGASASASSASGEPGKGLSRDDSRVLPHRDSSEASSSGRPLEREEEDAEDGGIEGILKRLEKERNWSFAVSSEGGRRNGRASRRNGVLDPGDTAAEIVPNGDRKMVEIGSVSDVLLDGEMHRPSKSVVGNGKASSNLYSEQNQIRMRLQHLESDLTSALQSLRSNANSLLSSEGKDNSLDELHRLSDAWEFQETEVMHARDELRSIRAKLAVLEGKMALQMIEAQKVIEERQKKLDAAQKALHLLRTACIVWPNPASEVFLAGSFDGWTSQRRMEKSRTGIFLLYLKLYPGRYEIKFIVDGTWKIDPLRPTVNNNGNENNLLIVP